MQISGAIAYVALGIIVAAMDGRGQGGLSECLFIAMDTVKGHKRIIYQKLQVRRRTKSASRSRELEFI